jgi:diacylglycerol kinase family enzyme
MKLAIIANPVAGRGRAYKLIRRYLKQQANPDWEIDLLTTQSRGHAGLLARELMDNPPDLLAVCGGDGTLNEVASQIPALKRVDLGKLGPGARRRFLFVTGIGFDAYVASSVHEGLKSVIGIGAYALAIARGLQTYSFPEFQVIAKDRVYTATSCLASNGRRYGGDLLFCPDADMCDGRLDILVLQGRRRLELARFLIMARLQRPETREWIHRFRTDALRIEGPSNVCVHADGEIIGGLPLDIGLTPSSFSLVTR